MQHKFVHIHLVYSEWRWGNHFEGEGMFSETLFVFRDVNNFIKYEGGMLS